MNAQSTKNSPSVPTTTTNTNNIKGEVNMHTWVILGSAIARAVGRISGGVAPTDFASKIVGLTLVGKDFDFKNGTDKFKELCNGVGASIDEEIMSGEYPAMDHFASLEEISLGSVNMLKGAEAVVVSSAMSARFNLKDLELPVFIVENEEEFGFVGPFSTGVEMKISHPNYKVTDDYIEYDGGLLDLKEEGMLAIFASTQFTFNVKDPAAFRKIKA